MQSTTKRGVFGWAMGKLAKDDELLTVAVADYGRRLNLDGSVSLDQTATSSAELRSRTTEVGICLRNEGLSRLCAVLRHVCDLSNAGSDSSQPWHDEVARGACGCCCRLRMSYGTISHGCGGHCGNQDHPGAFRVQPGR